VRPLGSTRRLAGAAPSTCDACSVTNAMRRPAGWFVAILVMTGISFGVVACGGPSSSVLSREPTLVTDCKHAGSTDDLHHLQTTSIEFGLDYLLLRDKSATATVVSAQLIEPSGNIKLADVAFQPLGGVGGAIDWGSDVGDSTSSRLRQSLPAHLSYTTPTGPEVGRNGLAWQLAVGVRISAEGGMAHGVLIKYTSGGHSHTIVGKDSFGVFHTEQECDSQVPDAGS
jgi:hypothetical protein